MNPRTRNILIGVTAAVVVIAVAVGVFALSGSGDDEKKQAAPTTIPTTTTIPATTTTKAPPIGQTMSGSSARTDRTGPITSGICELKIATNRVMLPSTTSS